MERISFGGTGLPATPVGFGGAPFALLGTQPGLHSAIVGTTNPAHVAANIAAARKGPLPEDQVTALRTAFSAAQGAAGEAWTGQT